MSISKKIADCAKVLCVAWLGATNLASFAQSMINSLDGVPREGLWKKGDLDAAKDFGFVEKAMAYGELSLATELLMYTNYFNVLFDNPEGCSTIPNITYALDTEAGRDVAAVYVANQAIIGLPGSVAGSLLSSFAALTGEFVTNGAATNSNDCNYDDIGNNALFNNLRGLPTPTPKPHAPHVAIATHTPA